MLHTELKQRSAGFVQSLNEHNEQVKKQVLCSNDRIAVDADQHIQACATGTAFRAN